MTRSVSTLLVGAALLATLVALALWYRADAQVILIGLLAWIEGLGPFGPIILIALETIVVVFLLPGIVLTLGAGYLFGFVAGTRYLLEGTTQTSPFAFLVSPGIFLDQPTQTRFAHPTQRERCQ